MKHPSLPQHKNKKTKGYIKLNPNLNGNIRTENPEAQTQSLPLQTESRQPTLSCTKLEETNADSAKIRRLTKPPSQSHHRPQKWHRTTKPAAPQQRTHCRPKFTNIWCHNSIWTPFAALPTNKPIPPPNLIRPENILTLSHVTTAKTTPFAERENGTRNNTTFLVLRSDVKRRLACWGQTRSQRRLY